MLYGNILCSNVKLQTIIHAKEKSEKTIGKKENRIRAYMLLTDIINTTFCFVSQFQIGKVNQPVI